jgi:Lipopolysaccharide-assembly, LptC-related
VVLRLSRKTSLLLSGALLLAFFFMTFVVSSWTRTQSLAKQDHGVEDTSRVEKLEERPSGSVVLTNFHRSQTKNGRKEWDITADVGEYVPNSNLVRITNGVLVLFREDGSTTTMTAPSADIELAGADLKSASCSGGVTILYDTLMKLTTEFPPLHG